MRKIFPLKPAAARTNDTAAATSTSSRKSTPVRSRRASFSSFLDKVEVGDAESAGAPGPALQPSLDNSFRSQQQDGLLEEQQQQQSVVVVSSSRAKREHWCPNCAAPGSDVKCATPPSGDENLATLEEIKTLVVANKEAAELSFLRRHAVGLLEQDTSFVGSSRPPDAPATTGSSRGGGSGDGGGLLINLPRAASAGRGNGGGVPLAPVEEPPPPPSPPVSSAAG